MSTPKFSFVVPVFNGEKFLTRLIASFEKQTYQNLEFVFVDDASFDATSTIISNFKARDPRVVYFKFDINQGTYVARAHGFKIATGDYICSVDADDEISENYAEAIIQTMQKNKADMCLAEPVYLYKDGKKEKTRSIFVPEDKDIIKNGEGFDRFFAGKNLFMNDIYSWGKVFSKVLYKKCQEDIEGIANATKTPLSGGEDLLFITLLTTNSKRMTKCYEAKYFYHVHNEQSTQLNSIAKYESQYSSVCKILYFIKLYLEKVKKFEKYEQMYKGWQNTYRIMMEQDAYKLGCKRLYYKLAYEHGLIEKDN